jgi:hypothetical protein
MTRSISYSLVQVLKFALMGLAPTLGGVRGHRS